MSITDVLTNIGPAQRYDEFKVAVLGVADSQFEWLRKAISKTTEQLLGDSLAANPPDVNAYDPSLFDEHLSRANGLLDRCVERSMQINELEAQAFLSGVGYLTEESQQDNDHAVARLNMKAARRQADAGPGDADESILQQQVDIRRGLRRMRMAVHDAPGHALNYHERLSFLRELQAYDVRSIYELTAAARFGLNVATGIIIPAPPAWSATDSNNLRKLVAWSLNAIRKLELGRKNERVVQRVFRLSRDLLVNLGDFTRTGLAEPFKVNFDLTSEKLKVNANAGVRLLSLGLAVELDETSTYGAFKNALSGGDPATQSKRAFGDNYLRAFREKLLFSLDVKFPVQNAQTMARTWTRPTLELRNEVRIWQNYENEGPATNRLPQVRNTNPIGRWEISLFREVNGPDYPMGSNVLGQQQANFELLQFKDVVVWLRLAVREAQ